VLPEITTPSPERNPDRAVLAAQVDHLYRQLPRVLGYTLLVMGLLAYMTSGGVPVVNVVAWLGAMLLVVLLRGILYLRYRRTASGPLDGPWAGRFVFFAGLSGITWGMAGVLLFAPAHLELQALVLLVLAGMGAGSAAVLPMYLPAFYAYFPISMLPAGIMMFLQGGSFHVIMGVFDLVFIIGLLSFGRAIGEAFRTSLTLRFENVELVAELRRQKEAAERANLAKSKFLAAASHDLRQPMHALRLFSETLSRRVTEPETRRLAASIGTSVEVLARLFNALLDISKLDAGVLVPDITEFPVAGIIGQVANDCRADAEYKGLALEVVDCSHTVSSDATLLERILRNLVTNAVRYTEEGRVTIRCLAEDGQLRIEVADTGVGIPAEEWDDIFQEFYQRDNPERDRTRGLGLGLSIVRRLANLLGHSVELHSEPGAGSVFAITVPLATGSVAAVPTGIRPSPVPQFNSTVLVIDDDAEVRQAMRTLLEDWGCRVWLAAGDREAMAQLQTGDELPNAVIADFRLPGRLTGVDVVKRIRERFSSDIPALLISGDTEPQRLQEAHASGLELLHKPVEPARLRAWLGNVTRTA
jgi:signal transduction histidine kinase/CheY-like chemotaxis protein